MLTQANRELSPQFNRVPKVTADFWLIKLMAVTMGETAADYLAVNMGLGLTATSLIMSSILAVALVFQFAHKKYVPWAYWLAVVLISIVGTLVTDNLVDNFGVALTTTTIFFTVALAMTFALWYASGKNIIDPQHFHHKARGLLLAGDPVHLRPRNCGRRSGRGAFRAWISDDWALVWDGHRRIRLRVLCAQAERNLDVLAGLHLHPSPWRVIRRFALAADGIWRPRVWHDRHERALPWSHCHDCRLYDSYSRWGRSIGWCHGIVRHRPEGEEASGPEMRDVFA